MQELINGVLQVNLLLRLLKVKAVGREKREVVVVLPILVVYEL